MSLPINNGTTPKGSENEVKPTMAQAKAENEAELMEEYIDERSITIAAIQNNSFYRQKNMRYYGQKHEVIGSSINSCKILSSNKDEVAAYFPEIIGIASNHSEFVSRVKAYLSNIHVVLSSSDITFDTTFIYHHKKDYLRIKAQEDAITAKFDAIPRSDIGKLKEAVKTYVNSLNKLESTKFQFGNPRNITDYILYRHCLLYSEVAKDTALINSNNSYRFYIKDDAKEKAKEKKFIEQKKQAMMKFAEISGDDTKFNAVFIQISVYQNSNLEDNILKPREIKDKIMMSFLVENPKKFLEICNDKYISTKALIETLISKSELIRSEYNQQITTPDGTFIGSNMNEAVAYFNNDKNSDIVDTYKKKVKFL
jgi:hypothetical protein